MLFIQLLIVRYGVSSQTSRRLMPKNCTNFINTRVRRGTKRRKRGKQKRILQKRRNQVLRNDQTRLVLVTMVINKRGCQGTLARMARRLILHVHLKTITKTLGEDQIEITLKTGVCTCISTKVITFRMLTHLSFNLYQS